MRSKLIKYSRVKKHTCLHTCTGEQASQIDKKPTDIIYGTQKETQQI